MNYVAQYIREATEILALVDQSAVERTADLLLELRERSGRLFLLGVGGGAGHASHAVCDFRKITQIEAYAPSMQNVSSGPRFASIKIDSANLERVLSSRDGSFIVTRIRGALGFGPI